MVRLSDQRIEELIAEDVPYIDLTCRALGIDVQPGRMEYFTRERCVLAGVAVAKRIMAKLGCELIEAAQDGAWLEPGETFLVVEGDAASLHQAWKVCLNVFDHLSAVATKTRQMVDAAHTANPACEILTTRKSMPGAKDLLIEAVMIGGAFPHRLGLSETVLVFDKHLEFAGGIAGFEERFAAMKAHCVEKKLFVEADAQDALAFAKMGVDGIQLDKVPAADMPALVAELRAINPGITIIAAGGINSSNVAEYAATGVDGVATTSPYTAKPVDMSVRMFDLS